MYLEIARARASGGASNKIRDRRETATGEVKLRTDVYQTRLPFFVLTQVSCERRIYLPGGRKRNNVLKTLVLLVERSWSLRPNHHHCPPSRTCGQLIYTQRGKESESERKGDIYIYRYIRYRGEGGKKEKHISESRQTDALNL